MRYFKMLELRLKTKKINEGFNKFSSPLQAMIFDIMKDLDNSNVLSFENVCKILDADGIEYRTEDAQDKYLTLIDQFKKEDKDTPGYNDLKDSLIMNENKEPENLSDIDLFNQWNESEGKAQRIADYRHFAEIDEDFVITEDNIDEWALNNVSFKYFDYPKDKILAELLETTDK